MYLTDSRAAFQYLVDIAPDSLRHIPQKGYYTKN
jgi:hypothetical protein